MAPWLRTLFRGRRKRRIKLANEAAPASRRTRWLVRSLLATLVLGAMLGFFPIQVRYEAPDYRLGMITDQEILAPFTFNVFKNEADLDRERALAAESVLPIFTRRESETKVADQIARLDAAREDPWRMSRLQDSLGVRLSVPSLRALALADTGRVLLDELGDLLAQAAAVGLVGEGDDALLAQVSKVRLRTDEGDRTLQSFQLYDARKVTEVASNRGREVLGKLGESVLSELAQAFARPNVFYDPQATERARAAARDAVDPVLKTYQEGERIAHAHEKITADHVVVLNALARALGERTAGRGTASWLLPLAGRILLGLVLLSLFAVFLRTNRPKMASSLGSVTLITNVALLTLGIAAAVERLPVAHPFLIPIPLGAVLITLLLDEGVALVFVAWFSVLIALLTGWGLPSAVLGLVSGMTAVFAVRNVTHRLEIYRSMLLIGVAGVVAVAGVTWVGSGVHWSVFLADLGWAAANAAVYTALAMLLLPVFEKVFDLTTNISLLELSDLNRPIFRRMMIEANGTYHHSMVIGSLAEAAAEAIGANPLLARVGAYYHDIGKIAKSGYFGENLSKGGRNPHERLTPTMSSLILESHVREGLELAREIGLPRAVAAFIPEHQGTTLMQYFYNKAAESDPEVDERDYRYPGPKPQSKETAIVMLGDAAEATVRSLDEQTPNRIRMVLSRIFDLRIRDGQLDEYGLTIADMARVREAFTHVLTGVFHGRVKYQWQKDGGEERAGGGSGERVFHPELETGIAFASGRLTETYARVSQKAGQKTDG